MEIELYFSINKETSLQIVVAQDPLLQQQYLPLQYSIMKSFLLPLGINFDNLLHKLG